MSLYTPVIQGIYNVLPSAVRTATSQYTKDQILAPSGNAAEFQTLTGLIAYLNVTAAPGVDTVLLKLQEQIPASGAWVDLAVTLVQVATGLVKLKIFPGITIVAAAATGITVSDVLPALWRLQIVHSAASNFTYSLDVVGYV